MSENLETLFDAARKLPVEDQKLLAEKLLEATKEFEHADNGRVRGKARRHFGAWDSGNVKSADNEGIDRDLAREFASTHENES
jgi:hypothetical protein